MANGTYWAAKQIGKGAEAYAHNTIKKHEQLPLKLGMLNPVYFLMYATGEKINITQIEGQFPQGPFPTREEREAFVAEACAGDEALEADVHAGRAHAHHADAARVESAMSGMAPQTFGDFLRGSLGRRGTSDDVNAVVRGTAHNLEERLKDVKRSDD